MMEKPRIKVPDSIKKIDEQIQALEYQIMNETKEIDKLMVDREIHRSSLEVLKQNKMRMIDEEIFNSKSFLDIVEPEDEDIKRDSDKEWILDELSKEFIKRNSDFEGAQLVGFTSSDEPNQISVMVNSIRGFMFLEIFYEIIGDKKLRIIKVKNITSDEEMYW